MTYPIKKHCALQTAAPAGAAPSDLLSDSPPLGGGPLAAVGSVLKICTFLKVQLLP